MKIIVLSILALSFSLSAVAGTCADFSGRFRWDDPLENGFIKIAITQTDCTKLVEVHDQGWDFTVSYTHILDGVNRLIYDEDGYRDFEAATIDSAGVHIFKENHAFDRETGEPTLEFILISMSKDSADRITINRKYFDENKAFVHESSRTYTRYY